ncbi:MAG: 50S ribosomal protein L17 [Daejeonella sp.]|uniref:50S ribosomal protein L17 n=1 Tax=Daejeonella sp. TaxID=2805397 RepID=UPI00273421B4|nr:50S ribosomal protein L17 [Daejeonella sp.]MDP3467367.1 50S ribosomal protein L17 [Daejeonella sp.]
MRHGKKVNHLSRTDSHRRAMLANMASSLILHKRITTTLAKAKALRVYVEPIITKSKDDTTHSRRTVFSYLQNKEVVSILFRDIAAKVANRPGGYTRILKMGNRLGDNASMALIELVDYNEVYTGGDAAAAEKKTTRRRGSKAKSASAKATADKESPKAVVAAEEVEVIEAPVAEVETAEAVEAPVAETETTEEAPKAEATEEAPADETDKKKEE